MKIIKRPKVIRRKEGIKLNKNLKNCFIKINDTNKINLLLVFYIDLPI